jgi:hypothetical protein
MKLQSKKLDILDYVLYIGLFAMQEDRVHRLDSALQRHERKSVPMNNFDGHLLLHEPRLTA